MPSQQRDVAATQLRTYRILCVIAVVLIPAFWVVYRLTDPAAVDPLWLRFVMAVPPSLLFAFSYVSERVRRHMTGLLHGILYSLTAWFIALTALNSLAPNYAFGLMFVIVAIGVGFSTGLDHAGPLVRYLSFAVLATALTAFLTPEPAVGPSLFAGCIFSAAVVIYVAVRSRIQIQAHLTASEQRFRAASEGSLDAFLLFHCQRTTSGTIKRFTLTDLNARGEELLSISREEATGQSLGELLPVYQEAFFEPLAKVAQTGKAIAEEHPVSDTNMTASWIRHQVVPAGDGIAVTLRDITARKQSEEQLVEAKEHAEEMLRLKSSFLNNMSHELRTPLTSILGFADVLDEDLTGDQREFVQIITQNAKRLQETLNSVLDLARLESEGVTLQPEVLDVAAETREAVSLLHPLADQKSLSLNVEVSTTGLARLDRSGLHRVLSNLVSNAIKFTEAGGVTVEVSADTHQVHLRVQDTGIGISEAFLPHLFDEFKQQSSGLARSHEGSGLGLTITKYLVDLMDGSIEVESELGAGTTFTVTFPCVSPQCSTAPQLDRRTILRSRSWASADRAKRSSSC